MKTTKTIPNTYNSKRLMYLSRAILALLFLTVGTRHAQALPDFGNGSSAAIQAGCAYTAVGYITGTPTNTPVNVSVQTNFTLLPTYGYFPPLPGMSVGTYSTIYSVGGMPLQPQGSYPIGVNTTIPMGALMANVHISGHSPWTVLENPDALAISYNGTVPSTNNPQFTGLNATTCQCSSQDYQYMAGYVFKSLTATLGIYDEPLSYNPPVGNPVEFLIGYNSGEAYQPATWTWPNLGAKWNLNAVSYVQDTGNQWTNQVNITSIIPTNSGYNLVWYAPTNDIFRVQFTPSLSPANWQTFSNAVQYTGTTITTNGQFSFFDNGSQFPFNGMRFYRIYLSGLQTDVTNSVRLFPPGGGSELYTGYNPLTATFAVSPYSQTTLSRPGGNAYQLTHLDGSYQTYTVTNGSLPRQVFMSASADPAGNATKYIYNPVSAGLQLTQVIDAIGQTNTLGYTNSDSLKITSITDPFGHTANFSYLNTNGALQLITSTDSAGIKSQYRYSTNSLVSALTTPYGQTSFVYSNATGFAQVTATDPLGGTERVASIAQSTNVNVGALPSGMLLDTNWTGYRNTYYWTKEAYAVSTALTNAQVTHWAGLAGQAQDSPLFIKNPLEVNAHWFNYPGQTNAWGDSITLNEPSSAALVLDNASNQLQQASYDQFGNLTNAVDPSGRVSSYAYAANGVDLLTVKQGADTLAQYTYNSQHLPVYALVNGVTNQMGYAPNGLLLTITNGLQQVTTFSYNASGYLTNITGHATNATLNMTYDSSGRLYTIKDSDGYIVTNTYDALNRLTNSLLPDGTWIAQVYTNLSLTGIQSRNQLWSYLAYDANQNMTDATNQAGLDYHYNYCTCGALTGIVDPKGQPTTWTRDAQSRPTLKIYADSTSASTAYQQSQSLMKSTTDAASKTTTLTYNVDNTLSNISYSTPGTPSVSFSWDTNYQRITGWTDGQGANSVSYIPAGQPAGGSIAAVTNAYPATITYGYDVLGRLQQSAIGTNVLNLGYDVLGRINAETNLLGVENVAYVNASDRPATMTMPNGLTATFTYTPVTNGSLLQTMLVTNGTGATIERYDYTYDIRNLILTQTNLIGGVINAWSYGYDLSQRLTNAVQLTNGTLAHTYAYAYDPAGNRTNVVVDGTSVVETANIVNQLTNQTPGTVLTYDLAGNELARSNATSVLKLGWNGADQCTSITNASLVTLIQYDGLGHWVRITDYNGVSLVDDRRFVWSGNALVEERDATGTNVVKRFYANGFQQNGTNFYYLKDNLGSVREVTDANGNIITRFSYDPYGNRTQTVGALQVDYGFGGLFNIAGLEAAVHRLYDPTIARWINRDPIGETGGWNLYAYCGGNPVSFSDTSGLADWAKAFNPADFTHYSFATSVANYNPSQFVTIAIHGATHNGVLIPGQVIDSRIAQGQPNSRNAAWLWAQIKDTVQLKPNQPILLLICGGGLGGQTSIAAQIAKLSGRSVIATEGFVVATSFIHPFPSKVERPTQASDILKWQVFSANGKQTQLPFLPKP